MSEKFKTIQKSSEGIYKEKGSKFFAFAIPVSDVDKVKEILEKFRTEYRDARHICYAYMIGEKRNNYRTNDDGEPSGTAGKPILGQINSWVLTNILIVVVRYFGGVLLGTGGLTTAYKQAAADAIRNCEIIEKTIEIPLSIRFPYELTSEVSRIIKENNLKISKQKFETECDISFTIGKDIFETVKSKFENIYGLKITE
ncbi:MAG: IMPACT family protein [Paludibacteraceae bacterium]